MIPADKLVDTIVVHHRECDPQLHARSDALRPFQRKHDPTVVRAHAVRGASLPRYTTDGESAGTADVPLSPGI